MTVIDQVYQIFDDIKQKKYSFSNAINKKVNSLGLDATDSVIVKDTLKSVINRYYFFRSEIAELVTDIDSKDADILVLSLAMARYARNVTVENVIEFIRKSNETNNYAFNLDIVKEKLHDIAKNPTPIPEKYDNNFVKKVSLLYSYPEWIVGMMKKHFGTKNTFKMISSSRKSAPINICKNPNYQEELSSEDFLKTDIASTSYEYIGKNVLLENSAFVHKKVFVMDQMEQLLADELDVNFGDETLIIGGNHGHLATLISLTVGELAHINYACLNEDSFLLAKKITSTHGVNNVNIFESDAKLLITNVEYKKFSKVLVTPPNSELGLIRQKPEILLTFKQNELDGLIAGQKEYLKEASKFVKEDGILIYSVPTLNNKESFAIINEFIAENDEFELLDEKIIFPHINKTNGLYYAKLKKKSSEVDN